MSARPARRRSSRSSCATSPRQGLATDPTAFDGRSDYGPFIAPEALVAAGGLFSGAEGVKTDAQAAVYGGAAGSWYDPCYHQACDTFSTVLGAPPFPDASVWSRRRTPSRCAATARSASASSPTARLTPRGRWRVRRARWSVLPRSRQRVPPRPRSVPGRPRSTASSEDRSAFAEPNADPREWEGGHWPPSRVSGIAAHSDRLTYNRMVVGELTDDGGGPPVPRAGRRHAPRHPPPLCPGASRRCRDSPTSTR